MKFTPTHVNGAHIIEVNRIEDARGYFGRLWCEKELTNFGLSGCVRQVNVGFSPVAGTLRGLHFQEKPHREVKIIRCTRGRVFDVVLDIRPESPTFRKWHGVQLDPEYGSMLYIPEGCATGYLTLEPDSEVYYMTSEFYAPDSARGIRFDDPLFQINWPRDIALLSDADANWPDFGVEN